MIYIFSQTPCTLLDQLLPEMLEKKTLNSEGFCHLLRPRKYPAP